MIEKNNIIIQKIEVEILDYFKEFYTKKCIETTLLGNICKCVLGGTPNTSKPEYWNGNVNWINSGEVNNLRITNASRKITELGMNKSSTKLLPKGTTVLAITGATLGQISLLEIDTCANQSVVGVMENSKFTRDFIYPLICFHIQDLIQHKTGGAQPHINKENIENLQIKIPQEKDYVDYKKKLTHIFNYQSNLVAQNEKLKTIKNLLLQKYFG